ncbi:type VII secretion protein EssB [Listeria ilorinensis]|uniref:type VII secretion protein EssB n=1 Tax=Listeria ilorinensis TaxID=2867439 RepID=UPI001EF62538|nr:type VII secretion protein EssB [Listeria ilorinensis]
MTTNHIEMDGTSYPFSYTDTVWTTTFTESRTKLKTIEQIELLKKPAESFLPVEITHENDSYRFDYSVSGDTISFGELIKMTRADKLRALYNVGKLARLLDTRYTFFLHPDNLVFDLNLEPQIVHRGMKGLVPPYDLTEERFLKQYRCLAVAMFSKKYGFEDLYNGSLQNAHSTQYEKAVVNAAGIAELNQVLADAYQAETKRIAKTMTTVPKKKFKTFKGLAVSFIIAAIILAIPLGYFAFMKVPYQNKLLTANENFLKTDYDKVITGLEDEDPEKMPQTTQYELAYSYIQGEKLDDKKKENIMNNVSLKSDPQYLLYWIYNGRGEFNKSNDIAKLLDEPDLIIYSLVQELDQVKNDTTLSGNKKIEKQEKIEDEIKAEQEKLTKAEEEESTDDSSATTQQEGE